jgi:pimeloyl-ACP methyl ester carboxylesterase
MGHSMGGLIVQKVAERAAPRALILIASVGPGQLGAIRDPLATDHPLLFQPEEARQLWFHAIDEKTFRAVYEKIVPESPSVVNAYSGGQIHVDREAICCPVLVIGAEHDRTVVHDFRAIAAFYSCETLFVPGAGHDLMLEPAALDVAIKINQWLLARLPDEGLLIEKAPRILS